MFEAIEKSDEFHKIVEVAVALRDEFGVEIDSHPGGKGSETGTINRALWAMLRVLLGGLVRPEDDPDAAATWTLRRLALRRLADMGVAGERAEILIAEELDLGDAWLAYLVLAPLPVIEDVIRGPVSE